MSEDELIAERLKVLQERVREIEDQLETYVRNAFKALLAGAAYLIWVALHNIPALEVLFK